MNRSEVIEQNPGKVKAWVSAFRLRTLPLAFSCIGMGAFMAAAAGKFDGAVVGLCALTTLFLQILSNLANDYGDTKHGADSHHREGPKRAVQAGHISAAQMKAGMIVFALLSLASGILLLWLALGEKGLYLFLLFLGLGLASIWAAINYTAGSKPYGYAGLGDIFVFVFFGWVGVMGTYFLQTQTFDAVVLLPATACGFFATAVLNVNNIRDIYSDELAGKRSLPVRLGPVKARVYHWFLLAGGFLSALVYVLLNFYSYWQFLFLLALPLLLLNGVNV
ncbi:MAG: 1,4-dihydroxy-2-naphthoate polyprenyltransferase, partial [Hymenobacteraceae bacterium]|nr:1,4-dihydroxy-2-naphthoate polyprenyltransferase [Hymenobacteraceae bacterium]MDX5397672.1 1,4-dihydroxy-2-naphthoate polyprenyltransferase [Hymenobacteraceae bacterium]MDX5443777.1 1,4-dihydroxy-2-naphthoate polyprenyltransferase [Hymenobacteraceae bacterium]MDX5513748.1 1,4-dihydroxy-2-naphthoate polyprenyltransferase [Hymenobacteraceae bacterium]